MIEEALTEIEMYTSVAEKFAAFTSDGASNMMGEHKGAMSLLKKKHPLDTLSMSVDRNIEFYCDGHTDTHTHTY